MSTEFFELVLENYYLINGKDRYNRLIQLLERNFEEALDEIDAFIKKNEAVILKNLVIDKIIDK